MKRYAFTNGCTLNNRSSNQIIVVKKREFLRGKGFSVAVSVEFKGYITQEDLFFKKFEIIEHSNC